MKFWNTDMRHLPLDNTQGLAAAARRRGDFTRAIAEAATSRRRGRAWLSAVRCIARVVRKACRGWVQVAWVEADRIEWSCPSCGFEKSGSDLSRYIPTRRTRLWGVDQEGRDVLYGATESFSELRAVVARATPVDEIPGFLRIDVTVQELDELYTLVEHLTDVTRSRRRIELLDALRMSLSSAMDGF